MNLSREARLLLLAAQDGGDRAAGKRLLSGEISWNRLASLAQQEGATSIVWPWLRATVNGSGSISATVAEGWRKRAMLSEFHSGELERALHGTLETLAAAGIDAMLLKGSALAYSAYGSFARRPMSDLDLLVRPDQAREAWKLLQRHGWQWPAQRWPAEHYSTHQHLPPLVGTGTGGVADGARLEIHTALLPDRNPFAWPTTSLWQGAQRIQAAAGGREVLVPNWVDQVLHTCIHFAWSHEMRWGSWRAMRDILVLARSPAADWRRLCAVAERSRATTCCYWTLRLAQTLIGATVPQAVLDTLRPPRPEFLLRRLERHYVLQLFASEKGCPSEALCHALWDLGVAPRWSGHGSMRPWHVSEQWEGEGVAQPRNAWRLLNRARHAASAVGYLGKLTAARFAHPV